jgi:signal transduction histidine kinase
VEAALIELELELEAEAYLPALRADHGRIVQVLDNLIGNALKFSGKGARIIVGIRRQGDEVLFLVADAGPGLRPEQVEHVFDRFWQAERGDRWGSGLGLTLAKAIVDAHHGTIWVDSQVGIGTTFYFTIPTS